MKPYLAPDLKAIHNLSQCLFIRKCSKPNSVGAWAIELKFSGDEKSFVSFKTKDERDAEFNIIANMLVKNE